MRTRAGFSLIEILVATTILVVLVLIMSTIFHQSSVAWDGGMRKAEGNINARAVLGFMAREMSEAVADPIIFPRDTWIENNASQVFFVTMRGTNSTDERVARKITYSFVAGSDERIDRQEQLRRAGPNYGVIWSGPASVGLGDRIMSLKFVTSDGENYTSSLPAWVRIEMTVKRTADVSGLAAWSYGPDGRDATEDDVTSK